MARSHYQKRPLPAWCSGNKDNMEDRFIQLGVSFFEHPSVKALTKSEFMVLILMIKAAKGEREFIFPHSEFAPHLTSATFHDAKKGLIRKKFIELVQSGKCTREANRYKFTFGWKDDTGTG